jgi:GNAT superfamily N-acetyltransferase
MEFKIEVLSQSELADFWQLFSLILKKDFPGYNSEVVKYFLIKVYNQATFNYWIKTEWKTVLVAKYKDKIIGFVVIDQPYGGVSFCRWLGVLSKFRKKGVGLSLIKKWESLARKQQCHKMEIASQPRVYKFYQKSGLTMEGKRKLSYFGIDQYVFGKVIGRPSSKAMIGL